MKRVFVIVAAILVAIGILFFVVENYSFIFSRDVVGQVLEVERVTEPAFIGGGVPTAQVFSYAVAIQDKTGEIFTSSSEDRQWAVARKGMCVEAKFYPYPPWNFEKANTYFNARLVRLKECAPGGAAASPDPVPTPAPTAQGQ